MRVFRLTANEVQAAHVKWGPRIRCPGGQVFLPEFDDFMKPFIVRRANEAIIE